MPIKQMRHIQVWHIGMVEKFREVEYDMKNILFIMSDQHNSECFGFKNHPDALTPNLDALAAKGVNFDNAYCNNPICTPSRMCYLSSLYASVHKYYGLYGTEPVEKFTNMFSYFKEAGYRNGAMGKLHTPRYWIERDCQYVYDEFLEHPKYLEGAGLYDVNDNRGFTGQKDGVCSMIPYEHSCEKVLVKNFQRFIDHLGEPADRQGTKEPWFCWASFARPHQPYTPSKEFYDMFDADKLQLKPTSDTETDSYKELQKGFDEKKLRQYYKTYLALVAQVDYAIGEMVTLLEERQQLEHTIIVYCADHGDYASAHGLMEKRNGISSRSITKAPLIIVDPSSTNRGNRMQVVQSIDLFPTLCEMVGIDIPETVQGSSLVNIMTHESESFVRDYALTENVYRKVIATAEYRYIANVASEDELYDIVNDPNELHNLINCKEKQEVVFAIQRKMINALVRTASPVTTFEGFWYHEYTRDGRADMHKHDETSYNA